MLTVPFQSAYPDLVNKIITKICLLRECGLLVNIYSVWALMLGHTKHHTPKILQTAVCEDSLVFSCLDTFVWHFLSKKLNYVPRVGTRAVQKVRPNAGNLLYRSLFWIVYTTCTKRIHHPGLRINLDQTQVNVQDVSNSTFTKRGSKQVSIIGKEENKRGQLLWLSQIQARLHPCR
jgi:hypothetical protein